MLLSLRKHIFFNILSDYNTVLETGLYFGLVTVYMECVTFIEAIVLAKWVCPNQVQTPVMFIQLLLQSLIDWVIVHASTKVLSKNNLQLFSYFAQIVHQNLIQNAHHVLLLHCCIEH